MADAEEQQASRARREAAVQRILEGEDAAPPTVPAGWYAHPDRSDQLRYWDGATWTSHTAPAPTGSTTPAGTPPPAAGPTTTPAPPGPAGRDEVAYAWTLAVLPLLWLPFDYFVPAASAAWGAIVLAWIINGLLAERDAKLLRARGITTHAILGLLLVPAYLVQRTRRAGSTPLLPIVWCVGAAISVLGAFTFAASYEFDGTANGNSIARDIEDQTGARNVSVDCPDQTVRDGDVVWCDLSSPRYDTTVRVEIIAEGAEFSYTWEAN